MSTLILLNGKEADVLDLDVSVIDVEDIARRLSKICRFGAEIDVFYSDAQHCYNTSLLAEILGQPQLALAALHHEDGESLMGDMPTPIKYLPEMQGYKNIEKQVGKLLLYKFTGDSVLYPEIKHYDTIMLYIEAFKFHKELYAKLDNVYPYRDLGLNVYELSSNLKSLAKQLELKPWSHNKAKDKFIERHYQLTNDNNTCSKKEK